MSIIEIIKYVEPIEYFKLGKFAIERFLSNKETRIIPVLCEDNKINGIIERGEFLGAAASGFGREIYSRRPVSLLTRKIKTILPYNCTIEDAAKALSRPIEGIELPCAVIFNDEKYLGIIDSVDVFYKLSKTLNQKAIELEEAKKTAEAAMEAKQNFLASVSHEIRTPLNGIIGMTTAMLNLELDQKQRDIVNIIHNSGDLLQKIVNDILDMSKIEKGKFQITKEKADIIPLLNHSADLFFNKAEAKGIKIETDFSKISFKSCMIDSTRSKQVLFNIVSNAVKFTPQGKVKISAQNYIDNNIDYLQIKIEDTGKGMTDEFMSRIFKPFEQQDQTTTREYGGTGLGLSISEKIIKAMGGNIFVESELDKGSCFTIIIPIKIITDDNKISAPSQLYNVKDNNCLDFLNDDEDNIKILIVEDNQANQFVIKTLLEPFGFDLTFANNGQEAVDIYQSMQFDIILMDIQMPIKDGLTATREIREIEILNNLKPIAIIAVSANAFESNIRECLESGMNGHVAKPINLQQLLQEIERAVELSDNTEISYQDTKIYSSI